MIQTKLFEVRDVAMFIPVLATSLWVLPECKDDPESYLIRRAGFAPSNREVCVIRLSDFTGGYDPTGSWSDTRTMPVAHKYIREHWDDLLSGAVIDVEFIRGEVTEPRLSERLLEFHFRHTQNAINMINKAMGLT
jgi:hypothetical protein